MLVDLWAEWCAPCRMVGRIVDQIAREHGHQLEVLELDVAENPDIARECGIMSVPRLMVFRDGQLDERIVGAKGKATVLQELSDRVS